MHYHPQIRIATLVLCLTASTASAQEASRLGKDARTDEPPALKPTGLRVQHPKCTFATVSPDGRWLVTADHQWPQSRPDSIHVWDVAAAKPAGEPIRLSVSEGLWGGPLVSFDSKYLIVPSGTDFSGPPHLSVQVYDLSTLKSVGKPLNLPDTACWAVSSGGLILTARAGTGGAQLRELATGKPIGDSWTVNGRVHQIVFKPGDKEALLCTVGDFRDESPGQVECHELSQGARVGDPWPTGRVRLFLDSSGKFALTQSIGAYGRVRDKHDPRGLIRRWDIASGKPVGEPILPRRSGIQSDRDLRECSALHTDGRKVAVRTDDRTVQVFDMEAGKPIGLPLQHHYPIYYIEFSSDGKQLLTASGSFARSGDCWLWDVQSGKRIARIPQEGEIFAVAFHPNGKMVICGNDEGEVNGWELPETR